VNLRGAMKSDKKPIGDLDKGIVSPTIAGWCAQLKLLIAFLIGMNKLLSKVLSLVAFHYTPSRR
jgi:hypothetical protein